MMAPPKGGGGGRTTRSTAKRATVTTTTNNNNNTTTTTTTTNGVRVNQESLRVTRTTVNEAKKTTRRRRADEGSVCSMSMYSQSDVGRKEDNVIYFVLPEGLTAATCSPTLARTYVCAQDGDIESQWITEQDCIHVVPKPGNMFIVGSFEGPVYERLLGYKKEGQCYLLGPQVLLYLLQQDDDDKSPELDMGGSTPLFTVGMRNMLITLTGFPKGQKVEQSIKITKMMGICSGSLTKGVTHVIAYSLMTEKVLTAYKTNIPVMMPEWIDAVWQDSQNDLVHAVDEKYVKYACPIFHKLVVCVSQVFTKLKEAIRNVIEANGGEYSADLTRAKTSILIIPLATGEKYRFAQEWGVPCATPDWVEASKSAGHIVPWQDYPVPQPFKDHPPTSTPFNSMVLPKLHVPSNTDDSVLSNINGPTGRDRDRHVVSQYEYTEDSVKQAVELVKTMSDPFLDGCQIYICNNQKSEHVRKLVNAGAVRLSKISDRVTHIILPPNNQLNSSELQQFKKLDPRPCLMKVQWLIDSAKKGSATDEELYRINIDSNGAYVMMNQVDRVAESIIINQSSHYPAEHLVENIRCEVSSSSDNNAGVSSPTANNSSDKNGDNQQPQINVNQAKSRSHGSPVNKSLNVQVGENDFQARYYANEENENIEDENGMNLNQDEAEHVAEGEMNSLNESEPKLFSGLKFKVEMNNNPNQRIEIENTLTDNGGKLSSGADYNFLIVPTLYTAKTGEVHLRTRQWVNDCIDHDAIVDGDAFYFYKPRQPFSGMGSILVGVVVAISQYTNSEKEYISELVNEMGGKFQDMFARKTVNAVYRTTHLLCAKTDSDKYRAAQKWKTPVVVAEWVVESFDKKVILDIGPFDPLNRSDSQSTVNYLPQTPVVNSSRVQKALQTEQKNRKVSQLQQAAASERQHAPPTSPKENVNNHVFKTPTSKPRKSTPGDALNEEIPQTDSFIEWKLANPTSIEDMDNDPEFMEWRAQQPKRPTPPPAQELSPIIGEHYGLSRAQSRGMKALYRELMKTPSPDIGVIKLRRRQSTPFRDIMARDFAKLAELIPKARTAEKSQQEDNKSATSSKRSSTTSSTTDDEEIHVNPASFPKRLRINSSESESEAPGSRKCAKTSSISSPGSTSNYPASSEEDATSAAQSGSRKLSSKADDIVDVGAREEQVSSTNANGSKNDPSQFNPVEKNKEIPKPIAETQEHRPTANLQKLITLLANADDEDEDEEDDDDDEDEEEEEDENEETDNGKSPSKVHQQVIREEDQPCAEELDAPPVVWVADSEDFHNDMQQQVGVSPGIVSSQGRTREIIFKVPPRPTFSLSGLNDNDKRSVKHKLVRLGGNVSETAMFEPSSFAVIANTLARSEKVLCAIASGKPIVTSAYVDACMEADRFIPITEEFIWKESDAKTDAVKELAKSSFCWIRRILKDPTDTPFHGDTFFLEGKANNKFAAFSRLVQSGGGQIVENKEASTMVLVMDQRSGIVDGRRIENVAYLSDQIINPLR